MMPHPAESPPGRAVAILVFLFVTTTLVRAYVILTSSMEGSLRIGDHVLMNRLVRCYRPIQRGDIVAFLYPENVHQTFVKRVIGVAGDRLRLVDKQVIRKRMLQHNGSHDAYRDNFPPAPTSFTTGRALDMIERHVTDGEVIVPPHSLFVLGDNRDNSLDSRYWGFVPEEYVVGRSWMIYWSLRHPQRGPGDLEPTALCRPRAALLHEDALAANFVRAAVPAEGGAGCQACCVAIRGDVFEPRKTVARIDKCRDGSRHSRLDSLRHDDQSGRAKAMISCPAAITTYCLLSNM